MFYVAFLFSKLLSNHITEASYSKAILGQRIYLNFNYVIEIHDLMCFVTLLFLIYH